MDKRRKIWARLLAVTLGIATAFSTMPTLTTYAAQAEAVDADQVAYQEIIANKSLVTAAFNAVIKARKSEKQADIKKAVVLVNALSPTNKVRLYVRLSRDYYVKNFRIPGFRYFDVEKYLLNNSDVRLAGLADNTTDLYEYALEHYLEYGIFDARSSETSFDPVAAILKQPTSFVAFATTKDATPDAVYNSYVGITGKTDTIGIKVTWNGPGSSSKYYTEPYTHTLLIIENTPAASYFAQADTDSAPSQEDGDNEASSDSPRPVPAPQDYFINNLSRNITPYGLYTEGCVSGYYTLTTSTYDFPDERNQNMKVDVTFNGENYEKAKDLSAGKKYTFMIYMCGTDQEMKESYRRVSVQIASMLSADNLDNINVLLFLGGTEKYCNDYLNNDSNDGKTHGLAGSKSGIYYVNPSGLSDDVRTRLQKVDLFADEVLPILEGKTADTEGKAQGLTFNDIFNSDSLIQLSSTTASDMTDPGFLSGFINLSTDLFPAQGYGLSLSDHGGNLEGGVIFTNTVQDGDTKIEAGSITAYKLESALAATNIFQNKNEDNDGKLGFIFYDACLMGSTELAYNTKDYYRYMIASEEVTVGHTEYKNLLNRLNEDIKNANSDQTVAINLTKDFSNTVWHKGGGEGVVGSIAVYSSAEMDNVYTNFNALSKDLSELLTGNYGREFKNDIFTSIRKASLSSYAQSPSGGIFENKLANQEYIDIGNFLNSFKKNLAALTYNYSDSEKQKLEQIKVQLNKTLESGFLVYLSMQNFNGFGTYDKEADGKAIPLTLLLDYQKNIWIDTKAGSFETIPESRNPMYGSSIYMPLNGSSAYFEKSQYYKFYKNSALQDYVQFLQDYLDYYRGEGNEGYDTNKKLLAAEMSEAKMYTKLITQLEGNAGGYMNTITDSNNKEISYISFKVAKTYEEAGLTAPAHTTGSPMLDILETSPSIQLTAIHREYFKGYDKNKPGKEIYLQVDMICAEEEIELFNYAAESDTLYFDVTNQKNSIIRGYALNGLSYDVENDLVAESLDWQFVLKSSVEKNESTKEKVIQAMFAGEDELPSDSQILTVEGGLLTEDKKSWNNTYHVFKEGDVGYTYVGTVGLTLDAESNLKASVFTNPLAISAYHYVLKQEEDAEGNKFNSKAILEGNLGFTDGYFFAKDLQNSKKLYIDRAEVTGSVSGDPQNPDFTGNNTAYMVDPTGQGQNYSDIAYVSTPKIYEAGENIGNGILGMINVTEAMSTEESIAFINAIGAFIEDQTHEEDKDKPLPQDDDDDEWFINNLTDGRATEAKESSDSEEAVIGSNSTIVNNLTEVEEEQPKEVAVPEESDEEAVVDEAAEETQQPEANLEPKSETASEEVSGNNEVVDNEVISEENSEAETSSEEENVPEQTESEDFGTTLDADVSDPIEIPVPAESDAA